MNSALLHFLTFQNVITLSCHRDTVVLLGTVLDYMFLCNVASVKRQMSSLLTAMMDACRKGTPEADE